MKKIYYLIFLAIGVSGCSVESIDSTENLLTADAKMKLTEVQNFVVPTEICAGVESTFSFEAPVGTNLQVQQLIAGEWVQVFKISQSTSNPQNFNLLFEEAGDYSLRYKIGSGGFTETSVTVVNCNSCEESFSYTSNGEQSYTFYYTPAEDLVDATLVFTFAQSVAVSGLDSWTSNGVTKQKNMNLNACQEYSWAVTLQKNCSGGSQNSNVWTDFKVNDVSKKNENTPNLVQNCG
tara:strand:- start:29376 stop:30080 length:705 start_codon:yes stop_codon:yes gene_type:complete